MTTSPVWRKSSRSTEGTSEQCVELAQLPEGICLRDSKAPHTARLLLTHQAFSDLIVQAKQGKLSL